MPCWEEWISWKAASAKLEIMKGLPKSSLLTNQDVQNARQDYMLAWGQYQACMRLNQAGLGAWYDTGKGIADELDKMFG